MWVYTCSACGDQSADSDQGTAAAAFEEHARTVHNPTLLVTYTEPTGSEAPALQRGSAR